MSSTKPVIGWREWVSLPNLGIRRLKAKVDTGARSSALHAENVQTETRDDTLWVSFDVYPEQHDQEQIVRCSAPVVDHRSVRDSGGHEQLRYVIETNLQVGEDEWPIEVTLTSRDAMGFRMLLGRTAIRRRYVVDPGRSYRASKRHG